MGDDGTDDERERKQKQQLMTHRGFSRLATNSLRSLKPLRLVRPVELDEDEARKEGGENGFVLKPMS